MKKIIAVASEGGHWKQLNLLSDLFDQFDTTYVTTNEDIKSTEKNIMYMNDANKDDKIKLLQALFRAAVLFKKIQPDIIITTGAAPGLAFIVIGKIFNRKTIWIDSIANGDTLSLSGKLAKRFATHTLSQWQSVSEREGVLFKGALL